MQDTGSSHRLAAILAADMVGYSRLMGEDERGTLARLKTHRIELIDPSIEKNNGRIIKTTGDGMLVEFASVLDAVQAAVEIQRRMGRRNADVPANRRIEFRVGINLGDIILEDGDIFGDGVNIAARLEAQSDPGGICISRGIRDQLGDKLDVGFEDLGPLELKNIMRPVHAYRVLLNVSAAGSGMPEESQADTELDKPVIVVLPLLNMSGDAEQEFFADGLTEDILTELSRFRDLVVISRTSSFAFKGRNVSVQSVASELGAKYALEGSVRKAGNRVRITVQLIDAEADKHIWAEKYDRELEDIFAIQDEVTSSIVATLSSRMEAVTQERAKRKRPESMAAYECLLTGKRLHHSSNREANEQALSYLNRAIALDPNYAHAHAWRACVLGQGWVHGWCENEEETWNEVLGELEVARSLDDEDSDVHRILAATNLLRNDFDRSLYHQNKALTLNPNDDLIVVQHGELLSWTGQPDEGAKWVRKAMRINPYFPERFWNHLGRAQFIGHHYEDAVNSFRKLTVPDFTHHAFMAAGYAYLGDRVAAKGHAEEVLRLNPDFTISGYMESLHYKHESDAEHHREGLRKAGLPS
ncbi:adenylate/guanylate cyclase domain-containing protein [Sneathiella chinensis]|uniref:Guanylyl cyclase n=1 Tax=Sneathiella chinensis TaxID=349750 RepID=A0ABQ5U219_9PROT|nr:adenylate/guanylate cyclase domain-containing protein [Sneathiella chinensis]GLQ05746.1 guanylyl cyclase [Sneathiella chinensis]